MNNGPREISVFTYFIVFADQMGIAEGLKNER